MFKSVNFCGGVLGLLVAVCLWGCKPPPTANPKVDESEHAHGGHSHASHGPHDGDLIELGDDQFHGELLHDDASGKVTIYILDGAAKDEVSVAVKGVVLNAMIAGEPTQFELTALEGSTSGFEVSSPELVKALGDHDAKVKLNVSIDGDPFSGTVEHDHDHGHEH